VGVVVGGGGVTLVGAGVINVVVRVTVVRIVIYIDRRTSEGVGERIYSYRRTGVVVGRNRVAFALVVGAGGVGSNGDKVGEFRAGHVIYVDRRILQNVGEMVYTCRRGGVVGNRVCIVEVVVRSFRVH
jgi:hypothetical protein